MRDMVDNENNQWEDEFEYTEEPGSNEEAEFLDGQDALSDEQDALSDEQVEQDASEEYEEEGEYEEEPEKETAPKKSALPLVALLLVLLVAGSFIAVPKIMNKDANTNKANYDTQQPQNNQSTEDLAGSFFDAASGDDSNMMSINFNEDGEGMTVGNQESENNNENNEGGQENQENNENNEVATVTDAKPGEGVKESDLFADHNSQESDSIMVVYNKAARLNPFKPPVVIDPSSLPYETINNTQFEIIEPPTASIPDENLSKLLQTQISGIMYDPVSPAAIVNLNGIDHFVKVGDIIAGYKIEKITKDKVQISYKSNSYIASVGELFTKGKLEQLQAVADLEHKFGGRKKNNN